MQRRVDSAQGLEGRQIPGGAFQCIERGRLETLPASELFSGQTVALFALPGAFTPTCSNRHVPRFQELADALHEEGVDEIVCLAMNDPWVMAAWGADQACPDIRFLPDADGAFTRQLGMNVELPYLGERSRRYSMLVRHGLIEKAFVEPDEDGDPYGVSDADTLLAYLNPRSPALRPIAVFVRHGCPFCDRALALLRAHDLCFEAIDVGADISMDAVKAVSGQATVPQVYIGGRHIGGAEALERHLAESHATPAEAI